MHIHDLNFGHYDDLDPSCIKWGYEKWIPKYQNCPNSGLLCFPILGHGHDQNTKFKVWYAYA